MLLKKKFKRAIGTWYLTVTNLLHLDKIWERKREKEREKEEEFSLYILDFNVDV